MKKYPFILVSLLVVAVAAALFLARDAQLQANQANANDSQAAAETPTEISLATHEDYMHAAETVDVKTEGATGDVVVAGANVKIDGEVQGYVMAAGANVSINAPVGNDLFAAGANVDVNAPIGDNAMLAGSSVSIQKDATIGGNARIAGSSVDVMGRVMRNLKVAAANARVSSDVGGNADVRAERVVIDPGAVIHGHLTVSSPHEPVVSPEAQASSICD